MAKIVFLSPSNQLGNIGAGDYGSEAKRMGELCDRIEHELERHGVYAEREGEEVSVDERVREANRQRADIYVSIHSNQRLPGKAGVYIGTEIYTKNGCDKSARLGRCIWGEMKCVDGFYGRGMKQNANVKELCSPKMPACLVEVDYHDNENRVNWMLEHLNDIARAISKGILMYFDMSYREKPSRKRYQVIAGSFDDKRNAEQMARSLIKDGYPAMIRFADGSK